MAESRPPIPAIAWRDPWCVMALGFGAGALPKAPGTWGTLVAVPIYLLWVQLSLSVYLAVVLIMFVVGVAVCDRAGRLLGVHDHGAIVWDEMVGYWVSMVAVPFGLGWMAAGFALFRLFDIWKPWPIGWLDRRFGGGFGVMADDVLAGVYTGVCLHVSAALLAT